MNPMDYTKAFTEFWTAQSKATGEAMGAAMLKAQDQAGKALAEGMQAMASGTMPGLSSDLSGSAAGMMQASQAMMDLWSAATAMSGTIAARLPAQLPAQLPGQGGDATVESAMARMTDPRQWLSGTGDMDDVLGRMAEGPRLADLWEIERRYATVMQAWMVVRRRGLEHNTVMLEAWMQAGKRFMEAVGGASGAEGQVPDGKAALALWTETANRQLLETQRSDAFLSTQREMIRASTALRVAQSELVEHFGKQYGFPTRNELDDVHRTVTELRREVRRLRQEQRRAAEAAPVPAVPAPAAQPVIQQPGQPAPRQAKRRSAR